MTKTELFHHITDKHKWYLDYCSSSYATQLKQKFKAGNLGEKAIQRLFEYFGYELKTEEQWEAKD